MKKGILFICSGNYYRSRFAEEYFNYLAQQHNLEWLADSKGLSQNMPNPENPGPISANALEALIERNIEGKGIDRYPQPFIKADFKKYHRFIAMSEVEHRPMLESRFKEYLDKVEFFEVGDLPLEEPKAAMQKIAALVDEIVKEIIAEKKVA